MEQTSLRDSYNKWQQQKNSQPSQPAEQAPSSSYLSGMWTGLPIYNQDTTQRTEPEWYTSLSMFERYSLFFVMFLSSFLCFFLCFMLLPVLSLKPRKFGLLWAMGSFLFITSFGIMRGPYAYIKHLFSKERKWFSFAFFSSFVAVIYFSTIIKSSILSIAGILIESIALIYYIVSYFPFGTGALSWLSSVGISTARGALRI